MNMPLPPAHPLAPLLAHPPAHPLGVGRTGLPSVGLAIAFVLTLAVSAAACSNPSSTTASDQTGHRTTTPVAGPEAGVTSRYGTDVSKGSLPSTHAALAATHAFAAQVDADTAAFVSAVSALQTAADSGDITAARSAELSAQADYDAFRVLESGNTVNASTLDELAGDVGPHESFGGLHAVERDLWTSGPLVADVAALGGQAPVAQYLLSRERVGPEAIAVVAVSQLNWVVDAALSHTQEQYSHLGLVDVAATEAAAHRSFSLIEPLGRLVAPRLTATVDGQFAVLDTQVSALGPPTVVSDSSVSPAARLALSRQLDATAATLARLAAVLTPYGTAGAPS